jgi:hypothetical protein
MKDTISQTSRGSWNKIYTTPNTILNVLHGNLKIANNQKF